MYNADKTIIMQFLKGDVIGREFGILHAYHQIKLADGQPMQIGIGLVKGEFRHDIVPLGQDTGQDLTDKPVGMGIGIAYAQYRALMLVESGNPFKGMIIDGQHLLGIRQKLQPDLSEADGASSAVKEFRIKLGFQALNLPRNGGLGKAKIFGSLGVVQVFRQGDKAFKLLCIHGQSPRGDYNMIDTICA